ncbi:uncharacterized protein LOC116299767 [Actinia tenebrosa]|uniref:Uncharacterized protein LOC116299767 n=1 Tax=Actinia tenebrosa TaxID=6105 RepID=A0A6P8IDK3_ACTTE|nr:uncharacterized protein LOC116299767 [Actinia tenebrosa]
MGCSPAKSLGIVGKIHIFLGVLAIVFGVVALEVAPHNSNGVFGMGIWLGGWMLITGVVGLVSAYNTKNFCTLGGFIGCCLVGMVSILVCSIILGVAVLKNFAFESTVTREYYKEYDYAKYIHDDYYKPQEYFDQRNKKGRIGCGVYGSLLSVMILDVLTSLASCYIGKNLINTEQVNIAGGSQRQRRSRQIPGSSGIRGRVIVINQSPTFVTGIPTQGGFVATPYYPGPKLPNYLDIYPEGGPTWQSPGTEVPQSTTPTASLGPPPAYTPNATDSTTTQEENQTTDSS